MNHVKYAIVTNPHMNSYQTVQHQRKFEGQSLEYVLLNKLGPNGDQFYMWWCLIKRSCLQSEPCRSGVQPSKFMLDVQLYRSGVQSCRSGVQPYWSGIHAWEPGILFCQSGTLVFNLTGLQSNLKRCYVGSPTLQVWCYTLHVSC